MKFRIAQSELLNALTIVQKGLTQRATLPVLAGVYMETQGTTVCFQTTNLEMSVQFNVSALIEEEGKGVLPGKVFIDIVKNLPDASVFIEVSEESAVLTCESSSFSLRVLDPEDFPAFPQVSAEQQITIPFDQFANMAKKVTRMASRDESHPIITGVLIAVEDGFIKMVATDSYRLAVCVHPLIEDAQVQNFSAVLPAAFMNDLVGLPKTGEDISIALAANRVVVTYGETVFVNRRLEGNYVDYKRLLPQGSDTEFNESECETLCKIDRQALVGAVKRASVLNSVASQIRFSVNEPSQTIQLNTTQDAGSTQEIVKGAITGNDVEIGFNSSYIADGLSAINSDSVILEFNGAQKPGIIRQVSETDESYLYLVMPVRM